MSKIREYKEYLGTKTLAIRNCQICKKPILGKRRNTICKNVQCRRKIRYISNNRSCFLNKVDLILSFGDYDTIIDALIFNFCKSPLGIFAEYEGEENFCDFMDELNKKLLKIKEEKDNAPHI